MSGNDDGEEGAINISRDESAEDTAFFQPAQSDPVIRTLFPPQLPINNRSSIVTGNDDEEEDLNNIILSPIPSPTPLAARVWSAHSLYGEALLQSTRALDPNETNSTVDEEDGILGPQQPFIQEDDSDRMLEDFLVSPVSETPTTPPSVAQIPQLSPPPLTLPEIVEEVPMVSVPQAANSTSSAVPPEEAMSYSSRTPLRPPRVPVNQARHATTGVNASGHRRNHRRSGSDNSFMSALTDASFASVQTAPPPPRSLPLPLLSTSSSWTRYTIGVSTNQMPVLESAVRGMNISIPSQLQQPLLIDEESLPVGNPSNVPASTRTPLNRHSTPPRPRPPQGKSARKVRRPGGIISKEKTVKSEKLSNPVENEMPPKEKSNSYLPGKQRARSYSSDAGRVNCSSPIHQKPRSYSADLILHPEDNTTIDIQSMPQLPFYTVKKTPRSESSDEDDEADPSSIRLQSWLTDAFSQMNFPVRGSGHFGSALLALGSPLLTPRVLKVASSTASTATEISRLSGGSIAEVAMSGYVRKWSEWTVAVGVFSVLVGAMLHRSHESDLSLLASIAFGHATLLWLSNFISAQLWQNFDFVRKALHRCLSNETILCLLSAEGWPSTLLICGIMGISFSAVFASGTMVTQNALSLSLHLSSFLVFAGALETARRYLLGRMMHVSLYRTFGHKMQRVLQRICAIRKIARFARISERGGSPTIQVEYCDYEDLDVETDKLVAFEKVFLCLCSDRALSVEFGCAATKKDRLGSARSLYDCMATHGALRFSTLSEATNGNKMMLDIVRDLFPCRANGIVSLADFISSIECCHESRGALVGSIRNELAFHRTVDIACAAFFHSLVVCVMVGSSSGLLVGAIASLSVLLAILKWFDMIAFTLFARPYVSGDIIQLVGLHGGSTQQWLVESIGLSRTVLRGPSVDNGSTFIPNAVLARHQITVIDNMEPAIMSFSLKFSNAVTTQKKLAEFQRLVESFVEGSGREWRCLESMDPTVVTSTALEYCVRLRHRRPPGDFDAIEKSRLKFRYFCEQIRQQLGMNCEFQQRVSTSATKDLQTTYDADLSEYDTSALDFIGVMGVTQ